MHLSVLLISSVLLLAPAPAPTSSRLHHWRTGPVTLDAALLGVGPGTALIVTEDHTVERHHENQLAVLQALKQQGRRVSVGFEFLAFPYQGWVDRYVRGELPDEAFTHAVRWGGTPFAWYKPLILFPKDAGGEAVALNAPEQVTRALAQRGVDGLTAEERALLPPGFTLGSGAYFERFAETMRQDHGAMPEQALANFFAAQSAWDDTMAWQAARYLAAHPEQVLVIIVGDVHGAYGGGLPDRLWARGVTRTVVISQVDASGLDDAAVAAVLAPHPAYGPRADFIWITGR
ncbi:MAG TPA: ChaN family lipoprotein [bacterium]|nr:ChaN family lipoprotein [bacterium]